MKIVKGYFLFFSKHPIAYNFFGFLLNIGYLLVMNIGSTDPEHLLVPKFFGLINIIFLLNVILVYFISSKFITRKRNEIQDGFEVNSSEWFRATVLKNGEKIVINKPLWSKEKVYFIPKPRSMYEACGGSVSFNVDLKGRYKNSNMCIPVHITFELSDSFDKNEVFESLYNYHLTEKEKSGNLSLGSYVEYTFKKFNEKFQPDFDELTGRYALMEISEPYLLSNIIDMIIFPERLFTNVKNVKLCLDDPTFSSCKGMVDCST